ncbi:DUF6363 domain-containing protein [Pseudoalteromonas sp. SWYJZ12]|uniref:DUF6363 domain-containing protein n=1 Tax=Pseudoalteromonas sp. SWYJZ12 TaxID=2792067 RepID=UPI0035BC8694
MPKSQTYCCKFTHQRSTRPNDCKINIIAPPANFKVGRTTKKFEILNSGYNMGVDTAKAFLAK